MNGIWNSLAFISASLVNVRKKIQCCNKTNFRTDKSRTIQLTDFVLCANSRCRRTGPFQCHCSSEWISTRMLFEPFIGKKVEKFSQHAINYQFTCTRPVRQAADKNDNRSSHEVVLLGVSWATDYGQTVLNVKGKASRYACASSMGLTSNICVRQSVLGEWIKVNE